MSHSSVSVNGGSGDGITETYVKGGPHPALYVTFQGRALQEGKDYTLKYTNCNKIAKADDEKAPTVLIQGKGNFRQNRKVPYTVSQANLSQVSILVYDVVENQKPNKYKTRIVLTDKNGKVLQNGKDYDGQNAKYYLLNENVSGNETAGRELTKEDQPVAGDRILVRIKGKGFYGNDECSASYRILKAGSDIGKASILIQPQKYTGKSITILSDNQIKQAVLRYSGTEKQLKLNRDFQIAEWSYVNNIKAGTAKVTLQGIGNYGGYKTVNFRIGARSVADWWKGLVKKAADLKVLENPALPREKYRAA